MRIWKCELHSAGLSNDSEIVIRIDFKKYEYRDFTFNFGAVLEFNTEQA